jgi:predicted phosphodiesterase
MKRVRFSPGQTPLDTGNIADADDADVMPAGPGELLAEQFLDADRNDESANIVFSDDLDFFHLWRSARTPARRDALINRLYLAFRHRLGAQYEAFRIDRELPEYLVAAQTSAAAQFKVVVYGHTHLAKRVPLAGGAIYLNTGTWADLMMVPRSVLQGNQLAAMGELQAFVSDLENNRLEAWRRQVPTFARIEMDGQTMRRADVFVYRGEGRADPVAAESLEPVAAVR